jgi:hypothetical protein
VGVVGALGRTRIYTERLFLPISYFFHVSEEELLEYAVFGVRVYLCAYRGFVYSSVLPPVVVM